MSTQPPSPPRSELDTPISEVAPAYEEVEKREDAEGRDIESGLPVRQDSWFKRLPRTLTSLTLGSKEKKEFELNPQCIDYHARGYPKLAAWINSDENFLMCRRYGFLHTRVLLYRQDELRELEQDLLELDEEDKDTAPQMLTSRELDDRRPKKERRDLIQKIDDKLKEYDDIVVRARNMASLPQVTPRNFKSLYNYMHNDSPLCANEEKFIEYEQDFVALVDPQEGGSFDAFLEDWFIPFLPRRVARAMFSDAAQRISTSDEHVKLYSKLRIDTFARILITIMAVALLMAPVVVLFSNEESGTVKIVVILAFTLGFSAALSVFTKAKRHEVFAATAA